MLFECQCYFEATWDNTNLIFISCNRFPYSLHSLYECVNCLAIIKHFEVTALFDLSSVCLLNYVYLH